ncbi:MAG: DUF6542 domain-containing protein [Pseudonocardiaceae bacterium]
MTGTRSRGPARRASAHRESWGEQSLLPDRSGIPWLAAALCALGLTAIGAFADIERLNHLGIVFQVCYFLGCLLAVVVVQRKGLFAPMVAPPLILAVAVLGVVLAAGSHPAGGGTVATALAVGTPLISDFPTMAITTGSTVTIGLIRLIIQRRPTPRHDL